MLVVGLSPGRCWCFCWVLIVWSHPGVGAGCWVESLQWCVGAGRWVASLQRCVGAGHWVVSLQRCVGAGRWVASLPAVCWCSSVGRISPAVCWCRFLGRILIAVCWCCFSVASRELCVGSHPVLLGSSDSRVQPVVDILLQTEEGKVSAVLDV